MPFYEITEIYIRKSDKREVCKIKGRGSKRFYLYRVMYCNYHNVTLEEIAGLDVHHIDCDVYNNSKENLELLTKAEHNKRHPEKPFGERSKEIKAKFSEIQKERWSSGFYKDRKPRRSKYEKNIQTIIALHKLGYSQVAIAKEMLIPRTTIQSIILRKAG